jgi:hypothetical protein
MLFSGGRNTRLRRRTEVLMNVWNRAEQYRGLAEECRRLAASTLSIQMKQRYLLMAKDYTLLADIEQQEHVYCTRPGFQKRQMTPEPLA